MEQYMAEYTINASMFDGGAWMPDPEPHQESHSFDAADDTDAVKKQENINLK